MDSKFSLKLNFYFLLDTQATPAAWEPLSFFHKAENQRLSRICKPMQLPHLLWNLWNVEV